MIGMFWDIPGPRRFLQRVVDSLEEDKHVVLVVPDPVRKNGLYDALRRALRERRLGALARLDVGPEVSPDPREALGRALDQDLKLDLDGPSWMKQVFAFDPPPARYLFLDGIDAGDRHRAARARELLVAAGESAQDGGSIYHIVATVSPEFPGPPDNVRLDRHDWRNGFGHFDIQYVLGHHFAEVASPLSEQAWLSSLCLGLAPGFPELAEAILEQQPRDVPAVCDLVRRKREEAFAEPGTQVAKAVKSLPKDRSGRVGFGSPALDELSNTERTLYRLGYLQHVPMAGWIVHPVAWDGDCESMVQSRIHEGQLGVLLPQVERVRRRVVEWLRARHGEAWAHELVSHEHKEEVAQVETELGPLVHHVFRNGPLGREPSARKIAAAAEAWLRIRHGVAHARVVPLDQIESAYRTLNGWA